MPIAPPTFDLYRSATQPQFQLNFTGLSNAGHTLVLTATGTKNPASTGTTVVLDAFVVGTATTQETSLRVAYGPWVGVQTAAASGGGYRASGVAGSTTTFRFTGTSVEWVTAKGPSFGRAQVLIDGALRGTVDLYKAGAVQFKAILTYGGLAASGTHVLVIRPLRDEEPLLYRHSGRHRRLQPHQRTVSTGGPSVSSGP